ncbi:hypothetical protein LIER_32562 [Lithospermum erythrorhizon]|uniref:Uncharacterized protein n=1 Tax=Lithospermum erythrorhizon TaxID=34254 RepID=A0AAV3RV42_LITER
MLINIREMGDHVTNLRESFNNLQRHKLLLNSDKCVFGVSSGKINGIPDHPERDRAKSQQDSSAVGHGESKDPERGSAPDGKDSSPDPGHIPLWGSDFPLLQRH